jgi:ABC-2 type transport system permease protein
MRLSKSWIIASKDFKVFLKKKIIIYSVFVIPLLASVFLPVVIYYVEQQNGGSGIPPSELTYLLPALTFFYLILAALIPTTIASYSIIGEKVEKSFERLLATPTTDGEILLGKGISSFLPPLGAILVGATIYMALMDVVTHGTLGYYFFPNWNAAIVFFLTVPLATIMSVEWNVIVSARVSDVRVAQQIGMLLILPFAGVYVGGELGIVQLGNTGVLLIIAGILLAIDLLLLYVARAMFRREEILTKWK